eukprot:gene5890-7092_t
MPHLDAQGDDGTPGVARMLHLDAQGDNDTPGVARMPHLDAQGDNGTPGVARMLHLDRQGPDETPWGVLLTTQETIAGQPLVVPGASPQRPLIAELASTSLRDDESCEELPEVLRVLTDGSFCGSIARAWAQLLPSGLAADLVAATPTNMALQGVLSRLDASQTPEARRNAMDVISHLLPRCASADAGRRLPEAFVHELAHGLLARLGDEDLAARYQAAGLFRQLPAELVLPTLLEHVASHDGRLRSAAAAALTSTLEHGEPADSLSALMQHLRSAGVLRPEPAPGLARHHLTLTGSVFQRLAPLLLLK